MVKLVTRRRLEEKEEPEAQITHMSHTARRIATHSVRPPMHLDGPSIATKINANPLLLCWRDASKGVYAC